MMASVARFLLLTGILIVAWGVVRKRSRQEFSHVPRCRPNNFKTQLESSNTSMPTSVRSSQNCLAVFSKHPNLTFTRHSHPHRRESCCQADASCPFKGRGYAAAASRIKPNDSPPASSKSKPKLRSKAPAAGEAQRLSPSGLKAALRNNQLKRQEKEKESKQEELNSDPDAAAEYLAHITARQSGIDVWAMAIPETLGAVEYLYYIYYFLWETCLSKLDVQIPVRNKFPWGLNAMRYMMDNASNNIKNAIRFVIPTHLHHPTSVCSTMTAGHSVYHLGLYSTFPPLYSVPEFPYNPGVRPPPSTAPAEIKLYNPSHLYQLMNISSTSPKAWLAGIPGLSLHLYTQMCRATAECALFTHFLSVPFSFTNDMTDVVPQKRQNDIEKGHLWSTAGSHTQAIKPARPTIELYMEVRQRGSLVLHKI